MVVLWHMQNSYRNFLIDFDDFTCSYICILNVISGRLCWIGFVTVANANIKPCLENSMTVTSIISYSTVSANVMLSSPYNHT